MEQRSCSISINILITFYIFQCCIVLYCGAGDIVESKSKRLEHLKPLVPPTTIKMHVETKQNEASSESVFEQFEHLHESDRNNVCTETVIDPKLERRITYVDSWQTSPSLSEHS
jgi:hypothetical protein